MKNLGELPENLQNEIKDYLKIYNKVTVWYENGRYLFDICIKKTYAADHEFIGEYYADEIYTDEEKILNYVNEFYCYPKQYKGKRDYSIFHTEKRETYKMVNGNIVIA